MMMMNDINWNEQVFPWLIKYIFWGIIEHLLVHFMD